ncbi:hypothetical protein L211DRAFT_850444 [Terfezia boudieri ATCC MYA-4762]|uniref:Mid2 domain-containing protein n=1 Tax=Terfezia boudieri ATCC MYA-4762 TaxID=1051890 RepID=A0A3N4LIG8_9PEZI|nr:hypothetical protein L211DRAFT_850444 [Terfezia boudieri ATCC MYA-4762]
MVGGKQGEFLTSVQSSLTSTQDNETWWRMEAWQRGGIGKSDYEVHGTMLNEVNSTIGEERNQLSGVWEVKRSSKKMAREDNKLEPLNEDSKIEGKQPDPCAKGTKQLFRWWHKKDTTALTGDVGAHHAQIVVTGIVVLTLGSTNTRDDGSGEDHDSDDLKLRRNRLVRRQDTQEMTYTVTFSGNHKSKSAPLPMQGLVWENPGSGPPMKPFRFFTVEIPGVQGSNTTPTSEPTSSATSTDTQTTVTIPSPTSTHKPGDEGSPLPNGAIAGIVVGGVLAIVVFMVIFFLVKQCLAKKKETRAYPELAYIYSTPFTSANKRGQNVADGTGASSATIGTPRGARAPHATYYGPAAPQLEMDLGDQASFLPAAAAIGSPGRRGTPGIGTSRRAEEREAIEKEMSQPMLSGDGTHHEESLVRVHDRDFQGKF